jgi:hypothetical protein
LCFDFAFIEFIASNPAVNQIDTIDKAQVKEANVRRVKNKQLPVPKMLYSKNLWDYQRG